MGGLFSKEDKYEELKDEINHLIDDKIYARIDMDQNGIVTHNEFDKWKDEYKKAVTKIKRENEKLKKQFHESLAKKDAKIKELNATVDTLMYENERLEKYNAKLIKGVEPSGELKSIISKTKINEYVNEILENENINIKGLPDGIERAVYKNVIRIILIVLDKMAKQTEVEVLGHKMRIIIN